MDSQKRINPWVSIWTSPADTIRYIVQLNSNYMLWVLSALYGIIAILGFAQTFSWGYRLPLPLILLVVLIVAPFWGYLIFSAVSFVVRLTGKWLGGKGGFKEVRAALAWSNVPMIGNIILWALLIVLFGSALFQGFPANYTMGRGAMLAVLGILLLQVILSVWRLVIYINALAAVQQFSVLRSIGNIILAALIFGIFAFGLLLLFFMAVGA